MAEEITSEIWLDVIILVYAVVVLIWIYAVIRDRKEKGKSQDAKTQAPRVQMLSPYKKRTWQIENIDIKEENMEIINANLPDISDKEAITTKEKEKKREKIKNLQFPKPPNESIRCLLLQRSDLHERHADLFIDEVKPEHFSKLSKNKMRRYEAVVFKQGEQMRILLPEDHAKFKLFIRDGDVYLMKK